jgi:hypothetical protein
LLFRSFFLGGFECATGYNSDKEWIDQICATQHDKKIRQDYALLRRAGIQAAREAVRWPLVNPRQDEYDFSTVDPILEAAEEYEIDLIYDLFHYGYPDDVDLLSDDFPIRFADYCYEVARYIRKRTTGTCYFTPINEPSYFSWAAGEACKFAPHLCGHGWELKLSLARAAIAGIDAIWSGCPGARIVNADPYCRVVAPPDRPDLEDEVAYFNNRAVFESWDMLSGKLMPELGGTRKHLDIIGINYYWTNQWEYLSPEKTLPEDDPRCLPLAEIIREVWQRYGGEIMITETAHSEPNKAWWLEEVAEQSRQALKQGVPLQGVCLYPIISMPEWHEPETWTHMGLWDLQSASGGDLERIVHEPMLEALHRAQQRLAPVVGKKQRLPMSKSGGS